MYKYIYMSIILIYSIVFLSSILYVYYLYIKSKVNINKLRISKALLKDIDELIIIESLNKIKYSHMLGEKHITRDFDNYVTDITKSVYEAFKKKIYNDKNIIYEDEYIFKYIHNKTVIIYYEYLIENDNNKDTNE